MTLDIKSLNLGAGIYKLLTGPVTYVFREIVSIKAQQKKISTGMFLSIKKHELYHLWEKKKCCECSVETVFICPTIIPGTRDAFLTLFRIDQSKRNPFHRYGKHDACLCKYVPFDDIDKKLQSLDFSSLCSILVNVAEMTEQETSHVQSLRKYRNEFVGHPSENSLELELTQFESIWNSVQDHTLGLMENVKFSEVFQNKIVQRFRELRHSRQSGWKCQITKPATSNHPFMVNEEHEIVISELNSYLNADQFEDFEKTVSKVNANCEKDGDMLNHLHYLRTHSFLHQTKYEDAEHEIKTALDACKTSTNAKFYTVQILTAKVRMCVNLNNRKELGDTLQDIEQIIESDRTLFRGRIAGWFYYDLSRFYTQQVCGKLQTEDLNVDEIYSRAKKNIEYSIDNFEDDPSDDGPHSVGIAKLELASLILKCFGNKDEYRHLNTSPSDIKASKALLFDQIEDSSIPMDQALKFYFIMRKCDYFYRSSNEQRLRENVRKLEKLAKRSGRKRWISHATRRKKYLPY